MAAIDSATRRRIVFGVFLIASLGLLTGYFRESQGGPLHVLQDGVSAVATPFEESANRVARPFRDAADWAGDAAGAEDDLDRAQEENDRLQRRIFKLEGDLRKAGELTLLESFAASDAFRNTLAGYRGIPGTVVQRPLTPYASTVMVDIGRQDGVAVDDPVVAGVGWLVGIVTRVGPRSARVALINDAGQAVGAAIPARNAAGILRPSSGAARTFALGSVDKFRLVLVGDRVVTSGNNSEYGASHYPRGIPIGYVTSVGQSEVDFYKQIQVAPQADLESFEYVIVLHRKAGQ